MPSARTIPVMPTIPTQLNHCCTDINQCNSSTCTLEVDTNDVIAARRLSPLGKVPEQYYLAKSKHLRNSCGVLIRGLFARVDIAPGQIIGEYRGKRTTRQKVACKRSHLNYIFTIRGSDEVIDSARSSQSSFLRYINAPNNQLDANVAFFQFDRFILGVTIKHIKPDDELLAWYGSHTKDLIATDVIANKS